MNDLEKYEGLPFPVPHEDIVETCIDYWFDNQEVKRVTANSPLVPDGYKAVARDPGDDLILIKNDSSVHYAKHDTGELIKLAENMSAFLQTIEIE